MGGKGGKDCHGTTQVIVRAKGFPNKCDTTCCQGDLWGILINHKPKMSLIPYTAGSGRLKAPPRGPVNINFIINRMACLLFTSVYFNGFIFGYK